MSDVETINSCAEGDTPEAIQCLVLGVGGAGSNIAARIAAQVRGVDLRAIDTDARALAACPVESRMLVGLSDLKGLGCGGDRERAAQVAEAHKADWQALGKGRHLVFIIGGLGGGVGGGMMPVIAREATAQGAMVVSLVVQPFAFEAGMRTLEAGEAMDEVRAASNLAIAVSNDHVFQQCPADATVLQAFELADAWIVDALRSFLALVEPTGVMSLDFATLARSFSWTGGESFFASATGLARDKADVFVQRLFTEPLLSVGEFRNCHSVVVHVRGGQHLFMTWVRQFVEDLKMKAPDVREIFVGVSIDPAMDDRVRAVVVGRTDPKGVTRRPRRGATVFHASTPRRSTAARPVAATAVPAGADAVADSSQDLELFPVDEPDAQVGVGLFGNSKRVLYKGIDLDKPTFIRKGLRLH